jgi:isoleucyl-tRNA synthetase
MKHLKEYTSGIKLPLRKVYVKLRDFKAAYLGKFKYRVKRNNLHQRRKKTVDRRENLEAIYEIYKNLPLELQLSVVIETAYKIGTLNKFEIDENPPNEISLLEINLINE